MKYKVYWKRIEEHSAIVEANSVEEAIDNAEFLPDYKIQDGLIYDDNFEAHKVQEEE